MMCPNDCTIDHLDGGIAAAFGERFEHQVPKSAHRPTAELAVHRVPIAEFLGQIAPRRTGPRDPECRIKGAPMITRWTAPQRTCLNDEWLKKSPLGVRQKSSYQS